ncbi:Yhi9p [Cyberlindnera jadinii NRRL Y-1542]|uniref:Phenazine biosynthesis PhzC/PhzF protein n=1 Tax=Cyberlindnera jadinii (strain ATCC 18201 / CBS 1600 / BCRC 20928 / JCM 3617 / NBRC 0987 / NRRL Y-1542) TaxID=983966 RepID=A0A1E4S2C5_CYBJN|nr:phenazine biosynthesis PhzC/PhzF protein [Cyberlindnera jadinii NRRL Y-1542]ODV73666.1 phenazine biosynthesis PhzC/PhzF protein [Cyberlindnera jadinii NRRL Y-1542]
MSKLFKQVDVFTSEKFKGNPVAVFFNGETLSTEEMQAIANWTNLSETTFVLPATVPEADYQLRIFTTGRELPFAGHPTIGSCHAVLEAGLVRPRNGQVTQQCGAGLVQLLVDESSGNIKFKLPYYKHTTIDDEPLIEEVAESLGMQRDGIKSIVLVEDGPHWLTLELSSAQDVLNVTPNYGQIDKLSNNGFIGYSLFGQYPDGSYEARNLFIENSLGVEDPVCGSGAGADASLLAELYGFQGDLVIKQGRKLRRDGHISVTVKEQSNNDNRYSIYVGGNAITCVDGKW